MTAVGGFDEAESGTLLHVPTWSNPFCTRFVRPGALGFQFTDLSPGESPASRYESLCSGVVQHQGGLIVGPHGSGKSTLIASLKPQLIRSFESIAWVKLSALQTNRPWQRWNHFAAVASEVKHEQMKLSVRGLLVIDGAEQLTRFAWMRLLRSVRRRQQSVLATSHQSLIGIECIFRTAMEPKLIVDLTTQLLEKAPTKVRSRMAQELARRDLHQVTNIRDFWFDLYDVAQSACHVGESLQDS